MFFTTRVLLFQDECECEEGALLSQKDETSPLSTSQIEVEPNKIEMGAGDDVGPTPSQTEDMRSRLKSAIAENGSGELGNQFLKQ